MRILALTLTRNAAAFYDGAHRMSGLIQHPGPTSLTAFAKIPKRNPARANDRTAQGLHSLATATNSNYNGERLVGADRNCLVIFPSARA
jgi:hypothetical protein